MKNIPLLVLLLFVFLFGCKPTKKISTVKYNNGKVIYAIDVATENEVLKENFGNQAIVEFNSDLLKFTKNSPDVGFDFQLIELKENKTWNYLNFLGNEFRILEDERMTPKMGTPIFYDEYKIIAGFKCQKIEAPMGDGIMIAFVTKEITANYCPYLNIDGFAMTYTLPMPFGAVTYTATAFEKTTPVLSINNNHPTYASIKEFQAALQKNTIELVGQTIPDLTLKDQDGNDFKTEDLNNKITVFNCWFTSCAPCITEIPDLNKLKEKYNNADVQFLAITFDEKEAVTSFLKKHPFDFAIYSDQKEFINQLKIQTFPTTFITDKSGIIIHSESGGSFSLLEDLSAIIDTALKK